jgi:hypothetical protein
MHAIIAESPRPDVRVKCHAQNAKMQESSVNMAMANAKQKKSAKSTPRVWLAELTLARKMSRLSRETGMLSKQNQDLTEALRRIQLNRSLSADGMRAAIQEVLTKVGL